MYQAAIGEDYLKTMIADGAYDICSIKNDETYFCNVINDIFHEANIALKNEQKEKYCKLVTTECEKGKMISI